jgi:hypothetical protein
MTKEKLIEILCEADFDYITSPDCSGYELLDDYLENGFKGYSNLSYEELKKDYDQRIETGTIKAL